jgi:hypothetical protein
MVIDEYVKDWNRLLTCKICKIYYFTFQGSSDTRPFLMQDYCHFQFEVAYKLLSDHPISQANALAYERILLGPLSHCEQMTTTEVVRIEFIEELNRATIGNLETHDRVVQGILRGDARYRHLRFVGEGCGWYNRMMSRFHPTQ